MKRINFEKENKSLVRRLAAIGGRIAGLTVWSTPTRRGRLTDASLTKSIVLNGASIRVTRQDFYSLKANKMDLNTLMKKYNIQTDMAIKDIKVQFK